MAVEVQKPKVGSAPIAGAAYRPGNVPMVIVQAPDGRRELHTMSNARDLSRHLGWRIIGAPDANPVKPVAEASPETASQQSPAQDVKEDVKEDDASDKESVGSQKEPRLNRLETLRGMCDELGIKYDARWGVKKLIEEIKKVKPDAEISIEMDGFPPLIPPVSA